MSDLSLPKINAGNYSNGEPLSNFLDISLTKKRIQKAIHRQAESSCDSHYWQDLNSAIKMPIRAHSTLENISGKIEK
jgi:hypothetical protein